MNCWKWRHCRSHHEEGRLHPSNKAEFQPILHLGFSDLTGKSAGVSLVFIFMQSWPHGSGKKNGFL